MKKILMFLVLSGLYVTAYTQSKTEVKLVSEKSYPAYAGTGLSYAFVDVPTPFSGSEERWLSYQMRSCILKDAISMAKANGIPAGNYTVIISVVVNPDGSISNVKKTNEKIGYGLDEAAVKFVEGSGKWIPAEVEGKYVKSTVNFPVSFTIAYN